MNKYMELAYKEALKAYKKGEIPVGAVVVKDNKVLGKAHNLRQKHNSVFKHAEILAILKANKKVKDWRLNGCDLYVTLKPCSMCMCMINESRLDNVFYMLEKPENKKEFYKTKLAQTNVCFDYQQLLTKFFKNKRKKQ